MSSSIPPISQSLTTPTASFENRIGSAIRDQDMATLNDLKEECENLFQASFNEEERLFYGESLKLISGTLLAIGIGLHANFPTKIAAINEKIIGYVHQKMESIKGIKQILLSSSVGPYVEPMQTSLDDLPYREKFVEPAAKKASEKLVELQGLLSDPASSVTPVAKQQVMDLDRLFDRFSEEVLSNSWNKNLSGRTGSISPLVGGPLLSGSRARHGQNVLWDRHSATREVPGAVFTEARILGDGNCGFSALNTNRQEVMAYVKANLRDREVINLAAPEVKGWLKTANLSQIAEHPRLGAEIQVVAQEIQARNDAIALLSQQGQTDATRAQMRSLEEENETAFNQLSNHSAVLGVYMDEYYDKGGYLILPDPGTTGVLNIIAKWKDTPIQIWKQSESTADSVDLRYATGPINLDNKERALYIIHRNIHYNKFIPSQAFEDSIGGAALSRVQKFSPLRMYS